MTITGVVDRLERAGYVRREDDPKDHRRVISRALPKKADRTIVPLFAPMAETLAALWSRYRQRELAVVVLDFATQSNRVVREHTARLRAKASAPRPLKEKRARQSG